MGGNLFEIIITALLSGGLVQLINVFVNAKSTGRKDKIAEESAVVLGYKELLNSYAVRFAAVNERLDLTEKKYQLSMELSEKYEQEIDELRTKLLQQEVMIETLKSQLCEANKKADIYMQRITVLEQELALYKPGGK